MREMNDGWPVSSLHLASHEGDDITTEECLGPWSCVPVSLHGYYDEYTLPHPKTSEILDHNK